MMIAKNYVYRLLPKREDNTDLFSLAKKALSYGIDEFNLELFPEGEEIGISMELPVCKRSEEYINDVIKENFHILIQGSRNKEG